MLNALRSPVVLSGGHEVVATMSIGMALSETGTSRDDLLHDADVATRSYVHAQLFDEEPLGLGPVATRMSTWSNPRRPNSRGAGRPGTTARHRPPLYPLGPARRHRNPGSPTVEARQHRYS